MCARTPWWIVATRVICLLAVASLAGWLLLMDPNTAGQVGGAVGGFASAATLVATYLWPRRPAVGPGRDPSREPVQAPAGPAPAATVDHAANAPAVADGAAGAAADATDATAPSMPVGVSAPAARDIHLRDQMFVSGGSVTVHNHEKNQPSP